MAGLAEGGSADPPGATWMPVPRASALDLALDQLAGLGLAETAPTPCTRTPREVTLDLRRGNSAHGNGSPLESQRRRRRGLTWEQYGPAGGAQARSPD